MDLDLLVRELDHWAADGRVASLWWRDDDALAATPALATLLGLAGAHAVPVALAVIPAALDPSLAPALAGSGAAVLQHGYAHRNHAGRGAKSCELGGLRAACDIDRDLVAGRASLAQAFAGRYLPVVVPPWNRIDAAVAARLARLGFAGLSTFGPRRETPDGVVQCNTHVDPVAWRHGRGFVGVRAACAQMTAHLAARRLGTADAAEPTGLLTHHLVFDGDAWRFVDALLARTRGHPGARWIGAAEAFAPTCGRSA